MIADGIIRQIREGHFKAGDRLPTLKEIALENGVGYSVAREAMQRLVALGLADVRPRRGAIVRQVDGSGEVDDARLAIIMSDRAVEELYDLRLLIEVALAGQAAASATPEYLEGIRTAQRAFDAAVRGGHTIHSADVDLHTSIAQASGNAVFLRVLAALRGILTEIRAQMITLPSVVDITKAHHDAIVQAIVDGDVEAARSAMKHHIETAKATVTEARSLNPRH